MTNEQKLSKIFATMLQLEENSRIMQSQLDDLQTYKLAMRPANLVYLARMQLAELNSDTAYLRSILND